MTGATRALTREPAPWVDRDTYYVVGSQTFAEGMSELLVELGAPVDRTRVERFGPSG